MDKNYYNDFANHDSESMLNKKTYEDFNQKSPKYSDLDLMDYNSKNQTFFLKDKSNIKSLYKSRFNR